MFTTYGLVFRRVAGTAVAAALIALLLPVTAGAAAGQNPGTQSGEPGLVRTAAGLARSATTTALTVGAGYQRVGVAPRTVRGEARRVKALQRLLTRLGARPGPVDGLYGPLTQAGVARFQHKAGVAVDGIAGTQTARRLLAATKNTVDDTRPAANRPAATAAGRCRCGRRWIHAHPRLTTTSPGWGFRCLRLPLRGRRRRSSPG